MERTHPLIPSITRSHLLIPSSIVVLWTKTTTDSVSTVSTSTVTHFLWNHSLHNELVYLIFWDLSCACLHISTPLFSVCVYFTCRTFTSKGTLWFVEILDKKLDDLAIFLVGKLIYLVHDQNTVCKCQESTVHGSLLIVIVTFRSFRSKGSFFHIFHS